MLNLTVLNTGVKLKKKRTSKNILKIKWIVHNLYVVIAGMLVFENKRINDPFTFYCSHENRKKRERTEDNEKNKEYQKCHKYFKLDYHLTKHIHNSMTLTENPGAYSNFATESLRR